MFFLRAPIITWTGRRYGLLPSDFEVVTVGATATGLTATKVNASGGVIVYFSAGPQWILLHGPDPTSSVGLEVFEGASIELAPAVALLLRAIRVGPTNGKMRAVYFAENLAG